MKNSPRVWLAGAVLLLAASASLRAADPAPAKKNGYTVTVEVDVNEQGKPESVALASSEDDTTGAVLTKMAIAMAAKAEFPPREKDGHAVKYKAKMPFFFPIEDDEGAEANEQPRPRVKREGVIQPAYPLEESKAGEVGGVILELIIGADGKVTTLKTLRASKPAFEASAVQAVKQWTFVPAMADGHAVETRWRLAIVFESSHKMMEELKYRIAPRPSLGTFIIGHNEDVPEAPAAAPAEGAPGASKAEASPPSVNTPAK